ncbi:hypothetical protein Dvar_30760 [Desulfosarcina variabilis str. Montpellier]|uniref:hypothetical protein n=1 Tax=Desulfosarcina variabilis TaxID=2300 RepID=UPI003AFA5045
MKRTQIQLHDAQLKWLKTEALEQGISMSQLLRDIVDSFRMQAERDQQVDSNKAFALEAVGRFSSTRTNAS